MDTFKISGTTFRFPSVPADGGRGSELLIERRERVLAAARKVRRYRPAKPTERVSLATAKSAAPAGSVIEVDGQRAEVWAPGPAPRSVWALLDDGTAVLAEQSRYHTGGWHVRQTAAPDQRVSVVIGYVESYPGRSLAGDLPRSSGETWDGWKARLRAREHADHVHRLWCTWHTFYPNAPFPFDALVRTRDREYERRNAA